MLILVDSLSNDHPSMLYVDADSEKKLCTGWPEFTDKPAEEATIRGLLTSLASRLSGVGTLPDLTITATSPFTSVVTTLGVVEFVSANTTPLAMAEEEREICTLVEAPMALPLASTTLNFTVDCLTPNDACDVKIVGGVADTNNILVGDAACTVTAVWIAEAPTAETDSVAVPPVHPVAWKVVTALPPELDVDCGGLKLPQFDVKPTCTGVDTAGTPLTATSTLTNVDWKADSVFWLGTKLDKVTFAGDVWMSIDALRFAPATVALTVSVSAPAAVSDAGTSCTLATPLESVKTCPVSGWNPTRFDPETKTTSLLATGAPAASLTVACA